MFHVICAVAIGNFTALPAVQANYPPPREEIGKVLGKPIYRDQLVSKSAAELFIGPVMAKYRKEHAKEITPTEKEIKAATAYFVQEHRERIKETKAEMQAELAQVLEQLKDGTIEEDQRDELTIRKHVLEAKLNPPTEHFAQFVLNNWKFQKHLFDHYGEGRLLWQQAGIEAFDAMHKWIQEREKQGEFEMRDPQVRKKLYHYWTSQEKSPFLVTDRKRIEKEFIKPDWLPVKEPASED